MYVDPDHARRGIGRLIIDLCESAARAAGFGKVELMATLTGATLYRACGYSEIEPVDAATRSGDDRAAHPHGQSALAARASRDMVHPTGFEPVASAFGGQTAITSF